MKVLSECVSQFGFPAERRLKKSSEFQRVYQRQQRAGDQYLLMFADGNLLGLTRLGLSVSRKQGNAVRRNRLKRMLREAFRLSQARLPAGFDLVVIPRVGTQASVQDFQDSLCTLSRKIARRFGQQDHPR